MKDELVHSTSLQVCPYKCHCTNPKSQFMFLSDDYDVCTCV